MQCNSHIRYSHIPPSRSSIASPPSPLSCRLLMFLFRPPFTYKLSSRVTLIRIGIPNTFKLISWLKRNKDCFSFVQLLYMYNNGARARARVLCVRVGWLGWLGKKRTEDSSHTPRFCICQMCRGIWMDLEMRFDDTTIVFSV